MAVTITPKNKRFTAYLQLCQKGLLRPENCKNLQIPAFGLEAAGDRIEENNAILGAFRDPV